MKTSAKAVWMNLGGVASLFGVGFLVSLAGMLLFCVGIYLAMPLVLAAQVVAYRKIFPAGSNPNLQHLRRRECIQEFKMAASFNPIDSIEELDTLFERSFTEPVVLFKHSNSCGTSAYVFEIMSEFKGDIHLVTVQERRDISNAIAERTGIRHQTPQAFVIVNGEIAYSHRTTIYRQKRQRHGFQTIN